MKWWVSRWAVIGVSVGVSLCAVGTLASQSAFNHDENQFVAAAAEIARCHVLPYRDFAYFHLPYVTFVYAWLFHWTNHLLLAARLVSVIAAVTTVCCMAAVIHRTLARSMSQARAAGVALLAVLVLVTDARYLAAVGRAWNHDLPTAMLMASAAALPWAARGHPWRTAVAGALAGLAVGCRLTFLPAMLGLVVLAALPAREDRSFRWRLTMAAAGCAVTLLPVLWLALLAPRGFIFGNFQFPSISTAVIGTKDHGPAIAHAGRKAVSLALQLAFGLSRLPLTAIAILVMLMPRQHPVDPDVRYAEHTFGILSLFVIVGSAMPTPLYPRYFADPLPFGMAWLACRLARVDWNSLAARPLAKVAAVCAVVSIAAGLPGYTSFGRMFCISTWVPVALHEAGVRLATIVRGGPVLTVDPVYPLEGGLDVYPFTTVGLFNLRAASMVEPRQRKALHLTDPAALDAILARQPPGAVVVGTFELREPEATPMIEYAVRAGWASARLGKQMAVWSPKLPGLGRPITNASVR